MKNTFLFLIILILFSCNTEREDKEIEEETQDQPGSDKIKVLNFGTFHFGETPDANKTEFDEEDKDRQKEVRAISKMIAEFRPTIICVEKLPEQNDQLNSSYREYLKNPSELSTEDGEISMIAFDVARLNDIEKIYGIDNHMGYNYSLGDFIENSPEYENAIDPETYLEIKNTPFKDHPEIAEREKNYGQLSLLDKLRLTNEPVYLDHLINTNADKLLYVGIDDGFEGADNAAIFYHRNMKIYSNLNRIKMDKNDRVLILMGAAHTAFLREFINRSPKFEMVETSGYLK